MAHACSPSPPAGVQLTTLTCHARNLPTSSCLVPSSYVCVQCLLLPPRQCPAKAFGSHVVSASKNTESLGCRLPAVPGITIPPPLHAFLLPLQNRRHGAEAAGGMPCCRKSKRWSKRRCLFPSRLEKVCSSWKQEGKAVAGQPRQCLPFGHTLSSGMVGVLSS